MSESMERAVLEIATLNVVDGKGTEFESVFELAIPLISSIAGYLKHELNRYIENFTCLVGKFGGAYDWFSAI
jgi:heme-degrading monooxygenase HmoA